jgi:hypothetical protein
VHQALTLLGVPAAYRLITAVHDAFFGSVLPGARLTSLRRDEERSFRTMPHARPYYLCAALISDLLAPARGLLAVSTWPMERRQVWERHQFEHDAYGSRFLLVAPFSYDREAPDHWYAWDIDSCWLLTVVGAGVFGSAEDALAEWQLAVGPAAGSALSPSAPEATARLLDLPGDRAAVAHAGGKRAPGTHPGVLPAPAAGPRPRRRHGHRVRGLVRRRRLRPGARGVPGLVRGAA